MIVRVLAGENARPARRAQRGCHKRIRKMRPALGHRVEMRRLQERMPHEPHRIKPMIIGEDENDVPWLASFRAVQLKVSRLHQHHYARQ